MIDYITRDYPDRIAQKIYHGKAGSNDDPKQSVRYTKSVAESPQLQKFYEECKYQNNCWQYKPSCRLLVAHHSCKCIQKDHNQYIPQIAPHPSCRIHPNQDFCRQKNHK